jgi:hypothetical protein
VPLNEDIGLPTSYRRPPSLITVGVAFVLVVVVLSLLPGPGPLDSQNPPPTILGLMWDWLKANKDSVAPLSQLITSCGVVVAAITFLRTQRMNRSEWFFKVLKEVTDKLKDIQVTGYTDAKILEIIIFYSVLFSYYHYRLVGQREWIIVERDLAQFVRDKRLQDWLAPRAVQPAGFPPVGNFDDRFIACLRDLQSRGL